MKKKNIIFHKFYMAITNYHVFFKIVFSDKYFIHNIDLSPISLVPKFIIHILYIIILEEENKDQQNSDTGI